MPRMRRKNPAIQPAELARQIGEWRARLAPILPDIDPGDLVLILESLLRPFGSGKRFLLRPLPDGRGHVL